jgi:predicted flavoprotein YhiN
MLTHLSQRFTEGTAAALLRHAGIDSTTVASQLTREARRTLIHVLTALVLPVAQHRGWNYAEVTAGGVPLSEIDYRTMQSRKVPGLYLAGEVLDCDGRIGGFNFQWAWATGFLAGRAGAMLASP